jgi:hypothetical protein
VSETATRICAAEGCYERFATTRENRGQRYHAVSCRPKAVQQRAGAPRAPAWREERTCPGCGETFTATSGNCEQRYCGYSCSGRANLRQTPAPAPVAVEPAAEAGVEGLTRARHGPACPCLACSDRRAELGLAPLDIVIGGWRLPALPVD